jgi:excisionase family DNA binding protein
MEKRRAKVKGEGPQPKWRQSDPPAADLGAPQPISVRVPEAVRLTGISRSRLYELMRSGEIEHVKVGRSTLIPYCGLTTFIDQLRAARRLS